MDRLISNNTQVETAGIAKDIFCAYVIGHWSSEPHQQQQNYAERKYQHVKNTTNRMMERSELPANTWLIDLLYFCFLVNHTASAVLKWRTPLERLNGTTPDISPFLRFYWWQPVYYKLDDSNFPSETREKQGRFVGIAEHVGHATIFKILTDDTHKVISCSNARPSHDPPFPMVKKILFLSSSQTNSQIQQPYFGCISLVPCIVPHVHLGRNHAQGGMKYFLCPLVYSGTYQRALVQRSMDHS